MMHKQWRTEWYSNAEKAFMGYCPHDVEVIAYFMQSDTVMRKRFPWDLVPIKYK